jgi:hypothetical protein
VETVVNNLGRSPGGLNHVSITSDLDDDPMNNTSQVNLLIPVTGGGLLPQSGFGELMGTSCLIPLTLLLIAIILLARGLRKLSEDTE